MSLPKSFTVQKGALIRADGSPLQVDQALCSGLPFVPQSCKSVPTCKQCPLPLLDQSPIGSEFTQMSTHHSCVRWHWTLSFPLVQSALTWEKTPQSCSLLLLWHFDQIFSLRVVETSAAFIISSCTSWRLFVQPGSQVLEHPYMYGRSHIKFH